MAGISEINIGVICGFVAEAECLRAATISLPETDRPALFCSGADAGRTRDGVRALIAQGVAGLLSFGVAGGLDPALAPGTVIVATAVVELDGTRHATDPAWRRRVIGAAGGSSARPIDTDIAGSDRLLASVAAKRNARRATGAGAVDMESHIVAREAAKAGLPFLAVRAVSDPAGGAIPWAAHAALSADGRARPLAVVARLVLAPWQLPGLLALARNTRAALGALGGVATAEVLRATGDR